MVPANFEVVCDDVCEGDFALHDDLAGDVHDDAVGGEWRLPIGVARWPWRSGWVFFGLVLVLVSSKILNLHFLFTVLHFFTCLCNSLFVRHMDIGKQALRSKIAVEILQRYCDTSDQNDCDQRSEKNAIQYNYI